MKFIVACGVLLVSTCAFAGQTSSQVAAVNTAVKPAASFGYLDVDKDARLSRQEAKVDWAVAQRFGAADVNRDGYLDEEEFKALSRG